MATSISYLTQCQEIISPESIQNLKLTETLWEIATYTTVIAFTILGVGGFVAANVLATPVYASFAAMTILGLALPVGSCVVQMRSYSKQAQQEASQNSLIKDIFISLSQQTPYQTALELQKIGVVTSSEKAVILRPIFAKLQFLNAKIEYCLEEKRKATEKVGRLVQQDFLQVALTLERTALNTKIEAAFAHAVMNKNYFNSGLETIGTMTYLGLTEGVFAESLRLQAPLFVFKDHSIAPITRREAKQRSISELAKHLSQAE